MRDIIIVMVILVIIFLGSCLIEKKLKSIEDTIVNQLEIFQLEIENNNMDNFTGIKKFQELWNESKKMLNILTNHQIIDEVDIHLNQMIKNYELQDPTETFLNLIAIKTIVSDIHRGESFTLTNIL